jgi:hypothetical protein
LPLRITDSLVAHATCPKQSSTIDSAQSHIIVGTVRWTFLLKIVNGNVNLLYWLPINSKLRGYQKKGKVELRHSLNAALSFLLHALRLTYRWPFHTVGMIARDDWVEADSRGAKAHVLFQFLFQYRYGYELSGIRPKTC